jgi:hypothetical protein
MGLSSPGCLPIGSRVQRSAYERTLEPNETSAGSGEQTIQDSGAVRSDILRTGMRGQSSIFVSSKHRSVRPEGAQDVYVQLQAMPGLWLFVPLPAGLSRPMLFRELEPAHRLELSNGRPRETAADYGIPEVRPVVGGIRCRQTVRGR